MATCFFHLVDNDGKAGGAVVDKFYNHSHELRLVGVNHGWPEEKIRKLIKSVRKDEEVIIVDFSFGGNGRRWEWDLLFNITNNVIWIDHHKSAIDEYGEMYKNVKGIRRYHSTEETTWRDAGCCLAWEYFFPNVKHPEALILLGDYDIWKKEFNPKTDNFQDLLRAKNTWPTEEIWINLLDSSYDIAPHIKDGKVVTAYREQDYLRYIEGHGFVIEFEGYKCVACNRGAISSMLFDGLEEEFDIYMSFSMGFRKPGKDKPPKRGFKFTISTKREDIDIAKICKNRGGGGHQKVGGFFLEEFPFTVVDRYLIKKY